jgi:hypothetical protein
LKKSIDAEQPPTAWARAQWARRKDRRNVMHALKDLFTTDVGLMSVAGIGFMLGMAVFFVRYFLKHMKEDADKAAAATRR